MSWLYYPLVVLAGLSNPVQSAANTQIHKVLGATLLTSLLIYAVALLSLLVISPFLGWSFKDAGKIGAIPWWAWVGGVCNMTFLVVSAVATKKVGSGAYTVITLVTALLLSLMLDQFGIMGLKERPVTVLRGIGGLLAIAGAVLVASF